MSSKKKTNAMPLLNRKNILSFADELYSENNGKVSFVKLCTGNLSDGKDGNKILHCAIGEVYCKFVSNRMPFIRQAKSETMATEIAIQKLVYVAQLKNKNNTEKLKYVFDDLIDVNDNINVGLMEYCDRAKTVAHSLRTKIAPLLE